MDGFMVDASELEHAAKSTRRHQDEFTTHPATGWRLAVQQVSHTELAEALNRFQDNSQRALELLSADWGEVAGRLQDTSARYQSNDIALAGFMQELLRERGT
jgi:hypothetical protein